MAPHQRPFASIVWLGVVGLFGVSILFAPVVTAGWCADAPLAQASTCVSIQRSLLGIDTNLWLWLASVAVVVVVTAAAVRRRRKDQAEPGAKPRR